MVLHESGIQPLLELVAADPKIDWLRIVLHVGQCQLIEGRCRRVLEGERPENGLTRFIANSTRGVVHHISAGTKVVPAARPGERVGKLYLVAKQVRES